MTSSFKDNRVFYLIAATMIALFWLTQSIVERETYQSFGFSDTKSYIAISECRSFPSCSHLGNEGNYAHHHLQRWLPNLLVGSFSRNLSIDLEEAYLFFQAGVLLLFLYLTALMRVNVATKVVIFATILFFPYGFRSYFFAPPMIADSLFFLACFMVAISIFNSNFKLLFTALILAGFSRQTAMLLIPLITVFFWFGKIRLNAAIASVVLLAGIFIFNNHMGSIFYGTSSSSLLRHVVGIFSPATLDSWMSFLSRVLFFFLLLTPLLLFKYSKEAITIFLFCLLVLASQPILAGPEIAGGNILRLMAYSVAFIPMLFMGRSGVNIKATFLFVLLFVVNSLHHNYSILPSQKIYLSLVLCSSVFAMIIFRLSILNRNYLHP